MKSHKIGILVLRNIQKVEKKIKNEKLPNIYKPMSQYEDLFIVDRYRGRVKGIKFRSEFLGWIEGSLKSDRMVQGGLF